MDKELEKKSLDTGILRLPKNKGAETPVTEQILKNSNPSNEEDAPLVPPSPPTEPKPDFNAIYDILHGKFPEIINMNKPVLLAVGIRKGMSKETGVSSVVLKRWVAWYCRKSNYYANHTQGAMRFHLDGSESGIVTENHQKKMEKRLEKTKVHKTTLPTTPLEEQSTDSDDILSDPMINDI